MTEQDCLMNSQYHFSKIYEGSQFTLQRDGKNRDTFNVKKWCYI